MFGDDGQDWEPRAKTKAILDRGFELVNSVPYKVSARWVFYRLLQEGYYSTKVDYVNKWIKATSLARHNFYGGWCPDTMADDTRQRIEGGGGYENVADWMEALTGGYVCNLDRWYNQDHYIELWYEARAMTDQFRHYTEHITLVPMAGHPSIPYKWKIAKSLEAAADRYKNPIVILYFGDFDPAGETIGNVVERDVREWSEADFDFINCGLTLDQVERYNVPENFEKPGEYQWEALSDEGAKEIIESYTGRYLRHDAFSEITEAQIAAEDFVEGYMSNIKTAWEQDG